MATTTLTQRFADILQQIDKLESQVNHIEHNHVHNDDLFLERLQQHTGASSSSLSSFMETQISVVNCQVHGVDSQRYIDNSAPIQKMLRACRDLKFSRVNLYHVPENYYEMSLQQRATLMGAVSVNHLCKSMVVENVQYDPESPHAGTGNPFYSQYYCVVLQYTKKLAADKLTRFITRGFNEWVASEQGRNDDKNKKDKDSTRERVGKSNFQFVLADQEVGERLTGYGKGAMLPIGMDSASEVVVVLSHHINELLPRMFYMGGGEVDVKSEVSVDETIEKLQCLITDVTNDREEWDTSDYD